MYLHCSAYAASLGAGTDLDVAAGVDTVLQSRNSHLILSEPFNLIGSFQHGTLTSRIRFGNVALTFRGANHLYPLGALATIDSRPYIDDRRANPLVLPLNEEITLLSTQSAAGPALSTTILYLAKPQWSMNLPPFIDRITTRCTAVIAAGSTTTWTATVALVPDIAPYNGVYAVVGANVIAANAQAFRLYFPSMQPVQGRQLRPGGIVQNALGDFPNLIHRYGLGEWGRFHTFEMPSLQTFGDAAGGTYQVMLDLLYLGTDQGLLQAAA